MTLKEIISLKAGDIIILTATGVEVPILEMGPESEYFITEVNGKTVKRAIGQLIRTKAKYHIYKPKEQTVKERIEELETRVLAAEKAMASVWTIARLIGADVSALTKYRESYPKALYGEKNGTV